MRETAAEKTKKRILIFAGTTEGRMLSESLASAGVHNTVCVATEYGENVLSHNPLVQVHQGRMNKEGIEHFIEYGDCGIGFDVVVDATHPYAVDATHNIKAASDSLKCRGKEILRLRLKRDCMKEHTQYCRDNAEMHCFETHEECARALLHIEGNILLTTGSKELEKYCIFDEIKSRLYVRVLPNIESIGLCTAQGICGRQIIAMQGPFSEKMNEAVIRQYEISVLVTKESGVLGGYQEKLAAAAKTNTQVFVIGSPDENEGYALDEIYSILEKICQKSLHRRQQMEIVLAGIGMGNQNCMTNEVANAIREADILLGAERMLSNVQSLLLKADVEMKPYYRAEQIIPYLKNIQVRKKAVVLLSGDSGFYSAGQALYSALQEEINKKQLPAFVRILSGISSVSYLAARIGESYDDAAVYSIHGKKLPDIVRRIQGSPKTFLLTSGVKDMNLIGKILTDAGLSQCIIAAGYQLSYESEAIKRLTPMECTRLRAEGLYTCFIKNPNVSDKRLTHGMADSAFIRNKVPMTKEEVREVSICKLHLTDKSIVYDIGRGTGSMAVEIAGLSPDIQVYAVEHKKEAVTLIEQNKKRFNVGNISIVETTAPEGLMNLPAATHTFIGGSGGRLCGIIEALYQINPRMRVVVNAVSIETICEIKEIMSKYNLTGEFVQLQVSRARKAGNHQLMQSENPVWICAFDFDENKGGVPKA